MNTSNIEFARRFRGIEIENADIYELDDWEKFNIIITTENIEHVSHPKSYIEQIKKLVKPGGYILLTTPHNDKKATNLMGLSGDHFCAPNHQNYFNYQTISDLFVSHGFDVVDYWIDNRTRLNLYAFLKRFLIQRDQVIAFPPVKVSQKTIWKWQKDRQQSVIVSSFNSIPATKVNLQNANVNSKTSLKNKMKKILGALIPVNFRTHQIILAKYRPWRLSN
ncbi:MAG TPA: class I SAM-dependent methyltransferase [Mariniphaga anaerophila]|uniref:Class I SAM-dependent methyltransferase n=1 Tax=Mariniphaga anaerophila TaxID=1484053 RepID=A0A831LJN4_9BACT|nr:class I SAM-dependent methyltransferase [Mariniphaga anaerophila]